MNVALMWALMVAFIYGIELIRDVIKMKVDIRNIYLIFGYTLFYVFLHNITLLEITALIIASYIIAKATEKVMSLADQTALLTMVLGHYVTGTLPLYLIFFVATLGASYIVLLIKRRPTKMAGFPFILIPHLLTLPFIFYAL